MPAFKNIYPQHIAFDVIGYDKQRDYGQGNDDWAVVFVHNKK